MLQSINYADRLLTDADWATIWKLDFGEKDYGEKVLASIYGAFKGPSVV